MGVCSVCYWRGHLCRQGQGTVILVPIQHWRACPFLSISCLYFLLPRLEVSELGKDWGLFYSKDISLLTLLPPIGGAPASSLWEWAEFNGLAPKKRMWKEWRYKLAIRNVHSPCPLWSMHGESDYFSCFLEGAMNWAAMTSFHLSGEGTILESDTPAPSCSWWLQPRQHLDCSLPRDQAVAPQVSCFWLMTHRNSVR